MEPILTTADTATMQADKRMSWSAVFAGWVVAAGIASLMIVCGLALGFSMLDPLDGSAATAATGVGVATGIWMVLTWIGSLFLGGMFASWFDGNNDATMGTLHGITVWGLSIVLSGVLVAFGAGQAAHAGTALMLGSAATPSARGAATADQPLQALKGALQAKLVLRAQQAQATTPPSADGTTAAAPAPRRAVGQRGAMAAATMALVTDQPQTAKDILAATTTLSRSEIDATVSDASAQVLQYKIAAQATAERVAHYTAIALWVAFVSSLLGMLAAALGGWLGASHVHRVYHLRTYVPITRRGGS